MVLLNFFGDICLQGIDTRYFTFGDSLNQLMQQRINIGNLECAITESSKKKPFQPVCLSASRDSLSLLKPFQILSLANNHIQDYCDQGCEDTVEALNRENFQHFGLEKTVQEAIAPLQIEHEGIKLAFIGATRYANAKNGIGTSPENLSRLGPIIRKLKKENFFVVLYLHWGYEYVRLPAPRERKIAHRCIDYGADLIIGAHPHFYQCMETYRNKSIFYSLGNFIFDRRIFDGLFAD